MVSFLVCILQLLLCFLEHHVLSESLRELLEFYLTSNKLLIFISKIDFACFFIFQLDEINLCLCHSCAIVA